MKYKKLISFLAFFLAVLSVYGQNPFVLKSGEPVTVACGNSEEEVVHTALNLLNRDVESVFSTHGWLMLIRFSVRPSLYAAIAAAQLPVPEALV